MNNHDDTRELKISQHSATRLTIGITAATLLTLFIVALGAIPFGSPSVGVTLYAPLIVPMRALFALVPVAAVAAVLLGPGRALLTSSAPSRGEEAGALAALCLAAFVTANAMVLMHPMGWAYPATLVVNPASNSYFSTALHQPDLSALLRDYPHKMTGFISHAQTQSAGPVVFSGVATQIAKALPTTPFVADTLLALSPGLSPDDVVLFCRRWEPQISADDVRAALCVGLLMMAIGNLGVIPLYFLGKWLHTPGAGLFAAVSFVLLPTFLLFSVSVDQMYPLVTATGLCLVWRGVRALKAESPDADSPDAHSSEMGSAQPSSSTRRAPQALLWFGLSGVCLGTSLFFNMGMIVAIALCGVFALLAALRSGIPVARMLPGAACFTGGVLLIPVLLRVALGYDLWAVFLTSNHLRDTLYYNARSYPASLWANLVEFCAFCGVPVLLLWVYQGWKTVRTQPRSVALALLAAFVVTLLLLDLSGRVRGETARMWMFLIPPLLLGAGTMWSALWQTSRRQAALLLVLQVAHVTVFQYFVRVWGY